ncbi:hypothetical protein ADL01_07855 [Streptomyces sp. NRRL WC-3618]|nr:hypothetical protein ADL01_07855 [Streptomyces sp. NRRL WC-3618]
MQRAQCAAQRYAVGTGAGEVEDFDGHRGAVHVRELDVLGVGPAARGMLEGHQTPGDEVHDRYAGSGCVQGDPGGGGDPGVLVTDERHPAVGPLMLQHGPYPLDDQPVLAGDG